MTQDLMTYFETENLLKCYPQVIVQHRVAMEARRHRQQLPAFSNAPHWALKFFAGDILKYFYEYGPTSFFFEGLCLMVRGRGFARKQTTFLTRNVLSRVALELLIAYYLRRVYKLSFSDHKRKQFFYNKPRLYYLRDRLNRETRVRR